MGNSLNHIREIMGTSMESLIHHFKLVTEVRHVNLPALSGGELIQMAHKWKKVQMEFGA
jgi:hypothetical protein